MIDIDCKKIRKETDLLKLEKDWKQLENSSKMTVFQSFDWFYRSFREWRNNIRHCLTSKVYIYFLKQDDVWKIICPVIVQTKSTKMWSFGIEKGIYLQSVSGYTDYNNLIYENFDDQYADALISRIRKDFDGLHFYFNHIRCDSDLSTYFFKRKMEPYQAKVFVCVRNNGSIEDYQKSLSKHTRQNLRTAKNRMERDGYNFRIEVLNGKVKNKSLLRELRNMHIRRYAEKNYDPALSIFANTKAFVKIILNTRRELFNNIIYQCMMTADNGTLVLFRLNDTIVGYLYGLRDTKALRIMQNCVTDQFKFYSPSFRGAYEFILNEFQQGCSDIDFTRGNEQYKYMLGGTEGGLFSFVL